MILLNFGFNILPSENAMRSVQTEMLQYLDDAKFEVVTETLRLLGKKVTYGPVGVLRCGDLMGYTTAILRNMRKKGCFIQG